MSTTVTYKDNTLTTVNNATKTLKTAGKYMEDDITLVDDSDTGSVYQDQDGYLVVDDSKSPAPQGNVSITANGTYDVAQYAGASVNVEGNAPILQSKTATPSTLQQTITADSGYDGLSSVIVSAMPSGTEGTPTATKSSVSNHTISIIPSVTNTAGYISGGTQTGTAVSVSASELVSGTLSIMANGTADVVNYANVNVNVGGGANMSDPIRFFDYDGTLVTSYLAVPESLPSIPTHDKLTNGTWNYTLAQIATQFNAIGTCDVGANYDTASGCTEIDITLDSDHLKPYLCIAVNDTVTVDWGDGGSTDTITGTSWTTLIPTQHIYAVAGDYTISIDGAVGFYSNGNSIPAVIHGYNLTNLSTNRQYNREYCNCVTAIRVANGSRLSNYAFTNCYNLQSISIPSGVTSIGSYAFNNCYNLQSATIPLGITIISSNMFNNCYNLQSVSIPSSVTNISTYAFSYCYKLQSVSIPSEVTSIGGNAFNYCSSLQSVAIPSGVTSIGNYAFQYCSKLQSATIPSGVTNIGYSIFSYCYSLQSVSIPSSVTSIGNYAFSSCYGLQSITIPSSVTSINNYAFQSCYRLQSVSIPSGVTSIGTNLFYQCYSLQSVTIPSSITSIGNNAFNSCYGLQSITIPSDVTSIGTNAFAYCYGTYEYHLEPTTPPTLTATSAFNGIQADTIIYVPQGCLEAYQTATYWSTYASYMQEEVI